LQVLKLKPTPLTDEEKQLIADSPTIDTLLPRPTPEEQKAFIESRILGGGEVTEKKEAGQGTSSTDQSALDDFDDDIPF